MTHACSGEMLCSLLISVAMTTVFLAPLTTQEQPYSRWDNVDVSAVLKNERLLRVYFRCLLDQGRCSPDAAELKKSVPDALESDCAKCTEKQRESLNRIMKHIYHKKPDVFKQLEQKYDPEGTYRARHLEPAAKNGSTV